MPRAPVHPVLWALAGAMVLLQLLQAGAEAGVLGSPFRTWEVFSALAFFDPYFELARREGFLPAQLLWSLVTYAFLHGGWLHLGLNLAAFLGLGHLVSRMAGIWAFVAICGVSAVVSALAFGLIADVRGPLVGASGVVFGLIAVVTAWQEASLRRAGLSRMPIWRRIAGLTAINVVMAVGLGGVLAWEAHLGGFVGGWAMAGVFPPRGPLRRVA